MAYLDTNILFVGGLALALLAIVSCMVAWEVAVFKSGRASFRKWYIKQMYWLTYFCAFVLGATMLLRAAIWFLKKHHSPRSNSTWEGYTDARR